MQRLTIVNAQTLFVDAFLLCPPNTASSPLKKTVFVGIKTQLLINNRYCFYFLLYLDIGCGSTKHAVVLLPNQSTKASLYWLSFSFKLIIFCLFQNIGQIVDTDDSSHKRILRIIYK